MPMSLQARAAPIEAQGERPPGGHRAPVLRPVIFMVTVPVALKLRDVIVHGYGGPYPVERYATVGGGHAAQLAAVGLDLPGLRRLPDPAARLRAGPPDARRDRDRARPSRRSASSPSSSRTSPASSWSSYVSLAVAVLITSRVVLRYSARSARRRGLNGHLYAVVGTGELAEQMVAALRPPPAVGLLPSPATSGRWRRAGPRRRAPAGAGPDLRPRGHPPGARASTRWSSR